ncbi:MAG: DUF1080 domain-containing protein [Planctomycetes bacterium]|nr:DUF1080 domain-containing protein [Planctomycetota bacterium]
MPTHPIRRSVRLSALSICGVLLFGGAAAVLGAAAWDEYVSGIVWPEPEMVEPGIGTSPPSDAIVLFDGHDLLQWVDGENWIIENGYAIASKTGITTKQAFGDCQVHIEFATPEVVEGEGQGRGNSGVYLMNKYEVQILDSHGNKTYYDGQCASIYKQQPPIVNACRKPGEWQSYDIIFEAPRFTDDGKVARPAHVTVLQNGIVVQNHFEIQGSSAWDKPAAYEPHADKLPLHLQFHGNPIRFRNIWVRERIQPLEGKRP